MSIFCLQLRLVILCVMASIILNSGVKGDVPTSQNVGQEKNKNSDLYLLINDNSLYSNQPYQAEVKEIQHLGKAKDLGGLVRLAGNIDQTWGHQTDARGYFALMDVLTGVLDSDNFAPASLQEQIKLTQKYVLSTLAHGDVPLDMMARLLPRLISAEKITLYKRPFNASDWVQVRSTRAPLWLQTRQKIKQFITPNYDFASSVPMNNVIDLGELRDPKKAAARQQALQKSRNRMKERNDQNSLRFMDKIFSPMAEEEVVTYYSQTPCNMQQLKRLLDEYVEDAATKQKILDQVAKNASAPPHQ